MCDTCGCGITLTNEFFFEDDGMHGSTKEGRVAVRVFESLLSENDRQAAHNREHLDRHGILAFNLMSSPGAGKTSLLEATIDALREKLRIAVIEGDLETENDAERIRAHGVPAVQIATGSACHLDARMVHEALHRLDLEKIDLLFIENVGNLVCPACFDLGQHRNIALLSVPEGDDKPAKYPVLFRAADLVLLTKSDLLAYLTEFSPDRAERYLRRLATEVPFLPITTREEGGIGSWIAWLLDLAEGLQSRGVPGSGAISRSAMRQEGAFAQGSGADRKHIHDHHPVRDMGAADRVESMSMRRGG